MPISNEQLTTALENACTDLEQLRENISTGGVSPYAAGDYCQHLARAQTNLESLGGQSGAHQNDQLRHFAEMLHDLRTNAANGVNPSKANHHVTELATVVNGLRALDYSDGKTASAQTGGTATPKPAVAAAGSGPASPAPGSTPVSAPPQQGDISGKTV